MTAYRLIALDMDGTLLNDNEEISEANKAAIRRATEAGIVVCLSTGRGMFSLRPYIEELELQAPLVTVNGGEIWRNPDELYEQHVMAAREIERLHQLAVDHDVWFWGYAAEGVYNRSNWTAAVYEHTWLKFGYYTEDSELLAFLRAEAERGGDFEITNSHPSNLEINPAGVNKAAGLRSVCNMLGLQMEQVAAVGDSMNDWAMIREAGLGVAMGNAQQELKEAADWVTLSNEEDGVAHVLEKHFAL
ncbi:HAD family phosphatase [Xylanibacillus composti]|uniref:5-amino-6-(5-phospho-D-ribitylamino)uracil phosphatase YcsE n=1 Tax=Xylanibacillus composti TaxID=1572762 RepID=A0A8J4H049_9BACL|nr:Cof-type HAD-IIB family hydrolase [Xylanibacillus composti]MDT9723521.1 HAD family phosphatase [Xylanibacillus composti]GIQ68443.1 5-amino-6-(5-phospho-D-ribitylamino)uracil phosphatase YcsE [Xylanibacillus composti]